VILLDANVLMYAAGRPHPHKQPSAMLLERIARDELDAGLDAEVLQEVLHRYRAAGRWPEGRTVFDLAREVVPTVIPITLKVLDLARVLLDRHTGILARDALHAAAALDCGAEAFCSYDTDFDAIDSLVRVEPEALLSPAAASRGR